MLRHRRLLYDDSSPLEAYPFIVPKDFDLMESMSVDIVGEFNRSLLPGKVFAFTVLDTASEVELDDYQNTAYYYYETVDGQKQVSAGKGQQFIYPTSGSTDRYVIIAKTGGYKKLTASLAAGANADVVFTGYATKYGMTVSSFNYVLHNRISGIVQGASGGRNTGMETKLLHIPNGVTEILTGCFSGFAFTGTLRIPDTVTKTINYLFSDTNFKRVELPNSLVDIGAVFCWVYNAQNASFPSELLLDTDWYFFHSTNNLGIKDIGAYKRGISIELGTKQTSYYFDENKILHYNNPLDTTYDHRVVTAVPDSNHYYEFGDGVKTVEAGAFSEFKLYNKITIPQGVALGQYCFKYSLQQAEGETWDLSIPSTTVFLSGRGHIQGCTYSGALIFEEGFDFQEGSLSEFYDCHFSSIHLPKSITRLINSFGSMTKHNLTDIYCKWENEEILDFDNETNTGFKRAFNSSNPYDDLRNVTLHIPVGQREQYLQKGYVTETTETDDVLSRFVFAAIVEDVEINNN